MKTHPSAHAGRSAEHSTAGRAAPAIVKLYHSPHVTFVLHSINFYYQLQRIKRRIRNSHFGERKKKKYIMRLRGCIPRDAENSHSLKHTHTHQPMAKRSSLTSCPAQHSVPKTTQPPTVTEGGAFNTHPSQLFPRKTRGQRGSRSFLFPLTPDALFPKLLSALCWGRCSHWGRPTRGSSAAALPLGTAAYGGDIFRARTA